MSTTIEGSIGSGKWSSGRGRSRAVYFVGDSRKLKWFMILSMVKVNLVSRKQSKWEGCGMCYGRSGTRRKKTDRASVRGG